MIVGLDLRIKTFEFPHKSIFMLCGIFKPPVIYELFDQWATSEGSKSMAPVLTNPAQFCQL